MKCVICKHGETESKLTHISLYKGESIVVFKNVPAEVCSNCGEKYVSQKTTRELLKIVEDSLKNGVEIDIREYKAA